MSSQSIVYTSSLDLQERFNPVVAEKLADTLQGAIYRVPFTNGSFGVVKLAYALLVKAKKCRKKTNVAEDFINECRILTYLGNDGKKPPTILHGLDWWTIFDRSGSQLCFCLHMESVPGGELFWRGRAFWDLFKHNQNEREYDLWAKKVRSIFRQILLAVQWLHSKGVVHRDLSPENILLIEQDGFEDQIRIIDFGLATRCYNNNFLITSRAGKREYMAPEVFASVPHDGRSADIWSMGAILLFLLGGFCFSEPHDGDQAFFVAMQSGIGYLLHHWNRDLMSDDAMDILDQMLKFEDKRMSMDELVGHSYVTGVPKQEVGTIQVGDCENVFDIQSLETDTLPRNQLLDDDYVCTREQYCNGAEKGDVSNSH